MERLGFKEYSCVFRDRKKKKYYFGETIFDKATGHFINFIEYEDTIIVDLNNEFIKIHKLERIDI